MDKQFGFGEEYEPAEQEATRANLPIVQEVIRLRLLKGDSYASGFVLGYSRCCQDFDEVRDNPQLCKNICLFLN